MVTSGVDFNRHKQRVSTWALREYVDNASMLAASSPAAGMSVLAL